MSISDAIDQAINPSEHGILKALHALQAHAPSLPRDATNPHFRSRFTRLETVVEKIQPLLTEHDLVWSALPGRDEQGHPALDYQLAYAPTGEVIRGSMPLLLSKEDSQGLGSAITYARRYALCSVLNLVGEDDDDGNAAQGSRQTTAQNVTDAQNLTDLAKGLSDPTLNACLQRVGLEPMEKPWRSFLRVPPDKAGQLREVLALAHAAEGR